MAKSNLSQGISKYIRKQKTLIRHRVKSKQEADKLIKELTSKFHKKGDK